MTVEAALERISEKINQAHHMTYHAVSMWYEVSSKPSSVLQKVPRRELQCTVGTQKAALHHQSALIGTTQSWVWQNAVLAAKGA